MVSIASSKEFEGRKAADALFIPCWQGAEGGSPAVAIDSLISLLGPILALGDFKGKEGEVLFVYLGDQSEPRAVLLGLGPEEELSADSLRIAYAAAMKRAPRLKIRSLNVLFPKQRALSQEVVVRGVLDGLLLANYSFDALRAHTLKSEPTSLVEKITLIGLPAKLMPLVRKLQIIEEGVTKARDLVNGNADDVTPDHLALVAKSLAKEHKSLKATIFDKKRIEKEGMGLLLAVGQGACGREPAFILLEYHGNPGSKDHTVIIGKGITFDTGGLDIKTASGMETMKTDMSGAAACLNALGTIAALGLKVNATAIVAAAENSIGSRAYKPGDVYTGYSGKTVEIVNTDAEGRLTLADALAYAVAKLKPSRLIDLATLTGAIVVALGEEIAGLMSSDRELTDLLLASAQETGESLWPMPLPKSYKKGLKSHIADIKNCGSRAGSALTAGLFLQEFTGNLPWAHIDIAGVAYPDKPVGLHPTRATGFGVRLLVDLFERLQEAG